MHRTSRWNVICFILLACSIRCASAADIFSYQGKLTDGGTGVSDLADFQFLLFNDPSAGLQIASTLEALSVDVVDGLFTVDLNFGAAVFDDDALWLEIHVRVPAGAGAYTPLSPRQPLHPTPFAIHAFNVSPSAVPFNFIGANAVFNGGNVGIGAAAPAHALHVVGVARANGYRAGDDGSDGFFFLYDDSGNLAMRMDADNFSTAPQFSMFGQDGIAETVEIVAREGDGNPKVTLRDEAGNVRVEVDAMESSGAVLKLRDPATNLDSFYLNSVNGGEFGIGTSNPQAPLHIVTGNDLSPSGGGSLAVGDIGSTNVAMDANEIMARDNGAASTLFINHNGGDVAISSFGEGQLGVGTNNPSARLHVAGDARIDGAITIPATTRYLTIGADAFQIETDFGDLKYFGGSNRGFIKNDKALGGTRRAGAVVNLPQGAVIKYFEMINSVCGGTPTIHELTARLQEYPLVNGPTTQIMSSKSTLIGDCLIRVSGASTIDVANAVVDNENFIYRVMLEFEEGMAADRHFFYGVRIQYQITTPLP